MPETAVIQDPFIDSEQENRDKFRDEEEKLRSPNLLQMEEIEAAKQIFEEWSMQNKLVRNDAAQWKVNKLRERGFTGVHVVKAQDENRAFVPVGAVPSFVAMNKAARLKRRLGSTLYADDAIADPIPAADDDQSRDSATFARNLLVGSSGESSLDLHRQHRRAFDAAGSYGSGLLYYVVDEFGAFEPVTVMAHPRATDASQALIDPSTGLRYSGDPVRKFVLENGQLSKKLVDGTRFEWLPKIEIYRLTGQHVRFHPHTAIDVWEAEGASVGMMLPLGLLKQQFPVLNDPQAWPEEALKKLVEHRPTDFEELIPFGDKKRHDEFRGDERLVFVMTRYQKQSGVYDKGAYLVGVGGEEAPVLLERGPWYDERHKKPLDIPISQVKQVDDEDRPMGRGIMEFLGPGNEIRAAMLEAMLEWLDRFKNAKVYVPVTSNLQAKQAQAAMGTYIPIAPGGQPIHEDIPDFPVIIEKMFALTTDDLDDESGLQETAQGVEAPNVTSGKQAQTIITQVIIGLSDLRQNAARAQERSWRIVLQLYRAFFDRPQRVTWEGENGQHREKEWVGSDLNGTKDVRILPGSFTQLLPVQKDAFVQTLQATQRVTPKEARRLTVSNLGGLVRLDDDPHLLRVKGQISRWNEGPPQGWQALEPKQDPQTGQVVVPPDPTITAIFDPRPTDEIQEVALTRTEELGRAIASAGFARWDPMWQHGLVVEYERARRAAGVATIAEQQKARQAQLEAAKEEAERERQGRMEEKSVDAIEQVQRAQIEAGTERERIAAQSKDTEAEAAGRVAEATVQAAARATPDIN